MTTKQELLEDVRGGELHLHMRRGGDKAEWMATDRQTSLCFNRDRCIKPDEIRQALMQPRHLRIEREQAIEARRV